MDEYTKLKTTLEAYLDMPDVEVTHHEISIYTLQQILNSKLEELRKIQFDSDFKDEINNSYTVIQKVGRIFKKKVSICERPCTNVMASCDGKKSHITFAFTCKENRFGTEYLTICKDVDSEEIYFENHKADKDFVVKHYDRINECFTTLEHFSMLYQGGIGGSGKSIEQTLGDNFFDIKIICDTYGRIDTTTKISSSVDKENMFTREWLKRQTLKEFYTEHEEEILRKIPVTIECLNYTFKTIVTDALSKMNVPVLVKKK